MQGKIFDVCVDLRKKSKTYGKHFSIKLSHKSNHSILIPAGFAHGFLCLSKECTVYYKCSNYRDQKSETTTIVKSRIVETKSQPEIKIDWRIYTRNPAKPLVRDLIVEGLSLAKTQKEEFF